MKPQRETPNWTYKSVVSEVIVNLSSNNTKQIFNALMLVSGLLEHITNRLIELLSVPNVEDLETEHFERVFTAFAAQTNVRYTTF